MKRARRPSIWQIGRVTHDGHTIAVTGWGLHLCASACSCHQPDIRIDQDLDAGTLGLAKYRPCDCCQPWTWVELAAIVRDLADIYALGAPA